MMFGAGKMDATVKVEGSLAFHSASVKLRDLVKILSMKKPKLNKLI